jgi:DNA-binding response OmpR family regulator
MMKLLLIEDDAILVRAVAIGLGRRGYEVQSAADGPAGLALAAAWAPDLVILDVMMPGMDGWEVLRRLRERADTPVIMLTARGTQADVIRGLTLGADDYVKKPFDMNELALRVEAVLRRSRARKAEADAAAAAGAGAGAGGIFDDGRLRIDLARRTVLCGGQPVHLTPTEFRLLACLVRQRGRPVTHAELLGEVWGPGYADETANLAVYIRYLREKLEETPAAPRYICTEWGIGYRFSDSQG